jgi:iron(III) transport system substrate-binding protein
MRTMNRYGARTRMMFIAGGLISVLLAGMVQAGQPSPTIPATLDKLYEAAKKEGIVYFYASRDIEYIRKMLVHFNKKFPGIKVEQTEMRPQEVAERVIMESSWGKESTIDAGLGGSSSIGGLIERDVLGTYNWSGVFDVPKSMLVADGRAIHGTPSVFTFMYNTKLLKDPKFPKDSKEFLNSLLDPRWKGKLLVEARTTVFNNYGALVWGKEWMVDYLRKLREQKPILAKGGSTVANMVAAGEAPIGASPYLYHVEELQRKGAPVDWIRTSPLIIVPRVGFVTKTAPHPNAARLWVGWLSTREAVKLWEEICQEGSPFPGAGTRMAMLFEKEGIKLYAPMTVEENKRVDEYQDLGIEIITGAK